MWTKFATVSLISAAILSGCASNGGINKQQVGTVGGAVIGGLIGTQIGGGSGRTAAIIAGAAIGAYLGSEVGKYMDKQDVANTNHALSTTPTHHTAHWTNTKGTEFAVTPADDIYIAQHDGKRQYCRDYTQTATIDGKVTTVHGKACADSKNGPWRVVASS